MWCINYCNRYEAKYYLLSHVFNIFLCTQSCTYVRTTKARTELLDPSVSYSASPFLLIILNTLVQRFCCEIILDVDFLVIMATIKVERMYTMGVLWLVSICYHDMVVVAPDPTGTPEAILDRLHTLQKTLEVSNIIRLLNCLMIRHKL